MSDDYVSNGPVRTLPGSFKKHFTPCDCDDHPGVPAVYKVQGETDSFGCEYWFACEECFDEYQKDMDKLSQEEQYCEWCKKMKTNVRTMRDPDEGVAGRVYDVCEDCAKAALENDMD